MVKNLQVNTSKNISLKVSLASLNILVEDPMVGYETTLNFHFYFFPPKMLVIVVLRYNIETNLQ